MANTGSQPDEYSDKEKELGKVYDRVLMRRLLSYLKPYKLQLLIIGFLMVGTTLSGLAGPYLMQIAIDQYITPGVPEGLGTIAIFYVLVLVSQFVFTHFEEVRTEMIGQHVMYDIRQTLFSHLQHLDVQFFDRNPVGRLMTRVTSDVQTLNELFAYGVISVLTNLVQILGIMVAMLLYNWRLALVTFGAIPIVLGTDSFTEFIPAVRFAKNESNWHGSTPFYRKTSSV